MKTPPFTTTISHAIPGTHAPDGGYEIATHEIVLRPDSLEWLRGFIDRIPQNEYQPFPGRALLFDHVDPARCGSSYGSNDLGTLQKILAHYQLPAEAIPGHQGPILKRIHIPATK